MAHWHYFASLTLNTVMGAEPDAVSEALESGPSAGSSISPWDIGTLVALLLAGYVAGRVGRSLLRAAANRFDRVGRSLLAVTLRSLAQPVVLAGVTVGLRVGLIIVDLTQAIGKELAEDAERVVVALIWVVIGHAAYQLVDVVARWMEGFAARTESRLDDMLVPFVRKTLRVTIVVLLLVQVASVLSKSPLTSILAGLGVGGLAIALAAQDSIKNFFGSLMIFSDRPFELGDRVAVNGFDGTIESVGFRSTHIRTLTGHLVSVPNGELANKSIENISKRPSLRRILNLGLVYDTPPEKIEKALAIVKDILADHEGMQEDFPPRVFFNELAESALNLFVIYWYFPPNYWDFCAFNERVNLQILRRFQDEGIELAFPTQTVHLAGATGPLPTEPPPESLGSQDSPSPSD